MDFLIKLFVILHIRLQKRRIGKISVRGIITVILLVLIYKGFLNIYASYSSEELSMLEKLESGFYLFAFVYLSLLWIIAWEKVHSTSSKRLKKRMNRSKDMKLEMQNLEDQDSLLKGLKSRDRDRSGITIQQRYNKERVKKQIPTVNTIGNT